MANYTLFSYEGLELSINIQGEERIAKISLSLDNMYIEKPLSGGELAAFYRATRQLISRAGNINNLSLGYNKEDLVREVVLYLFRKKIDADTFNKVYKKFFEIADNNGLWKVDVVEEYKGVEADVFISLPQAEIDIFTIERIQNAAGDFMEAMGFELETLDEPVFGSFYQRLKYLLNGEIKTEATEIYKKGKTALEIQFVSVPSAEATSKLAEAAASLITSLSGINEAAIRLGAILVVKVSKDGMPMILAETVSPELALLLDKNPQLLKNPNVVFDLISTMRVPEKSIQEGSTEVIE